MFVSHTCPPPILSPSTLVDLLPPTKSACSARLAPFAKHHTLLVCPSVPFLLTCRARGGVVQPGCVLHGGRAAGRRLADLCVGDTGLGGLCSLSKPGLRVRPVQQSCRCCTALPSASSCRVRAVWPAGRGQSVPEGCQRSRQRVRGALSLTSSRVLLSLPVCRPLVLRCLHRPSCILCHGVVMHALCQVSERWHGGHGADVHPAASGPGI